ncbi:UNKNOWN [Stylonychia lemnae]|uniref:Pas domain s-box family protein n=1 Tax=Stylonychia lemnae TaxID=5949 RepID=A0A078AQY7_STYLE|nr:UNKNOWN [Stylonychia lemnae]|eukprot:CDW84629.1 UNKNOWN [Stylonychia lemnae]
MKKFSTIEEAKKHSYQKQILSIFIGLQRTILTYFSTIFFVTGIQILFNEQSTQDWTEYAMIILTFMNFVISGFLYFLSFYAIQMPIKTSVFLYNSINARNLILKEAIKVLIALQAIFVQELKKQTILIVLYYIFLFTAIGFLNIKRPHYYDPKVDTINRLCLRVILAVNLLCCMRLIFEFSFLEICLQMPLIGYPFIKLIDFYEEKVYNNLKENLQYSDKLSTSQIKYLICLLNQMLERQNCKDLKQMNEILYQHRVNCFVDSCICSQYELHVVQGFKELREESVNQLEKSIVDNEFNTVSASRDYSGLMHSLRNSSSSDIKIEYENPDLKALINADLVFELATFSKPRNELNDDLMEIPQGQESAQSRVEKVQNDEHSSYQQKQNQLVNFLGKKAQQVEEVNQKKENFEKMFDQNQLMTGVIIDDFFKELTDLERLNNRIFGFNAGSANDPSLNEANSDLTTKFDSQLAARKHIFQHLMYISFINQDLNKHFQAIYQLLKINEHKTEMKFFDKLNFKVIERLILTEAMTSFKKKQHSELDLSVFIDGNQQTLELDMLHEDATLDIIDFWNKFKSQNNDPTTVQSIFDLGTNITKTIKKIRIITKYNMAIYLKNSLVYKSRKIQGINQQHDDNIIQQQQQLLDEVGLCITQAWAGERQPLKFLYGNKPFCDTLKVKESQLPGMSINFMLPHIVIDEHTGIVDRFFRNNQSHVLGRMRMVLAKTLEGFLIPLKVKINFHYHTKYQYCFFTQVQKSKFLNLYQEEQSKVPVQDVMIFITDENLNIRDYSKTVCSILGFDHQKYQQFIENQDSFLNLDTIVVDLKKNFTKQFGENILPDQSYVSLLNKVVICRKYNKTNNQFDDYPSIQCILQYVPQKIPTATGFDRLNVFMMFPLSRHPDYDNYLLSSNHTATQIYSTNMKFYSHMKQSIILSGLEDPYQAMQDSMSDKFQEAESFIQSQSTTSSGSNSSQEQYNHSRRSFYTSNLKENLHEVQTRAEKFNQFIMSNQDFYTFDLEFKELLFITDLGVLYNQSVSFKHAINLFVSYGDSLNISSIFYDKGPLNVSSYAKKKKDTLTPNQQGLKYPLTENMQSLYFLFENGLYKMAYLGQQQNFMLLEVSEKQTDEGIFMLNISTYVSAAIITLIGIIIFPLLSRVIKRQYVIIKFFNYLEIEKIDQLLAKAYAFQKRLYKENYMDKKSKNNEETHKELKELLVEDIDPNGQRSSVHISYQNQLLNQKKESVKGSFIDSASSYRKDKPISGRDRFQRDQINRKLSLQKKKKQADNESNSLQPKSQQKVQFDRTDKDKETKNLWSKMANLKTGLNKQTNFQSKRDSFLQRSHELIHNQKGKKDGEDLKSEISDENEENKDNNYSNGETSHKHKHKDTEKIKDKNVVNQQMDSEVYHNYSAVQHFIDECFRNEKEIADLRKSLPTYLKEAASELSKLEDKRLCQTGLAGQSEESIQNCEQALDKLLQNGIGYAMYYIIGYIQQMNLKHDSTLSQQQDYLNQLMYQDRFLEISDLSLNYLSKCFDHMQVLIYDTGLAYFDQAKNNFLLAFGLYITMTVVFTTIIGCIVFKRAKQQVLDIQNMLILLPLEDLLPTQRQTIEKYLNQ